MNIKAIIFDVDGTMADTEDAHRLSFNKAFAENKLDWNWDVALYDKLLKVTGGKERIKYFVADFLKGYDKPDNFDEFVKHLHAVKTTHYTAMMRAGGVPLRPGIRQLINDARKAGVVLAIATTTSPENVGALLEVGLGKDWGSYFASVGCGDIVPLKKPAPDIYNWVLNEIKLPASDCIALEDSNNGLRSSLAAGIKTYITTNHYTRSQDFSGAAAVFEDLSNLPAFYQSAGLRL
ncbi:MAG: phosphatase [Gallionellales bacterium 35-53-114]|jgi:HAD superfamily hydrolase (TIGR01509 family)|nr:MAG: phosphatase [Gallionellales bacterium 35-53-114]OYZ64531.1 MAG: phosphatase [Gallionellales bacterium 24-53-125]OZB10163.1 MAG: phosphatase [Gallionellales bacterium 39-52-133]HQS56751.1 HAD-IA family hydrolase [Gallionellaceae bacterium]HQS75465.1 HAD-IA family hydrolase [Gallionellaceae bacterium]